MYLLLSEDSEGVLSVNGSIGAVQVDTLGILKGTGNINGGVGVDGGLAAGNSIGELNIQGSLVFNEGSTLYIEIAPDSSSQIHEDSTITISENTTFSVLPNFGAYEGSLEYTVMDTTQANGIEGTFTTLTVPGSFFLESDLTYSSQSVTLTITPMTIDVDSFSVYPGNNAAAVADALNDVIEWNRQYVRYFAEDTTGGENAKLSDLLGSLVDIMETDAVGPALDQMHPAALKGLIVSQEAVSVGVQEALSLRMSKEMSTGSCTKQKRDYTVWLNGMGDVLNQESNKIGRAHV